MTSRRQAGSNTEEPFSGDEGENPFSSAATSANGLNAEPVCRPVLPPVARLIRANRSFSSQ